MKSRIIWAVIVLAAIAGFYVVTIRPMQTSSTGFSRLQSQLNKIPPPEIAPPELPTPVYVTPTLTPPPLPDLAPRKPLVGSRRDDAILPRQEVPIQHNVTIDFSLGEPIIKTQGKDQEALEKALKEMTEATKDVSFAPTKK